MMLENSIKIYRKRAGLTQVGLAKAIGTSESMMVKLEHGARCLTSEWLERLGAALDIEPYLLIAPPDLTPSEEEVAELVADVQARLPAGLPYSEWPKAIAAGLAIRLRLLAGDRAAAGMLEH